MAALIAQTRKADAQHCAYWQGKRVLILGMARSGIAAAQLLCRAGAMPLLNDRKTAEELDEDIRILYELPCEWHLAEPPERLLDSVDVLLISPGIAIDAPIVRLAREKGIAVTGEMEVASQLTAGNMVALTGTNGKTTTVSLLGAIFRAADKECYVAGNIGYPLSAAAMLAGPEDVLAVEVSSFQLETTASFHPRLAAVLNLTEDHLNRHYSMENYARVKRHIFDMQDAEDVAVLNYDDAACCSMAEGLKAQVAWFSRTREVLCGAYVKDGSVVIRWENAEVRICAVNEIYIPGPHNLENALAAAMMAYAAGVEAAVIRRVLQTFRGVEHRIEFVRDLDGVKWYNDSKGTNVDSTIKAVQTMKAPTVLILGGSDKHVSFAPLAEEIVRSGWISTCVLCGATAPQIRRALLDAGYTAIEQTSDYHETVALCRRLATSGGNVLLSPSCASFDQFSDYEQRGRVFKQLVNALA